MRQHCLIWNQRWYRKRKVQTNIPREHRPKNPQENIGKFYPAIYKKNNTPWPKTSFILGMQDWFNIQKLINVINYIKSIEETTWSHQLMQKNHLKKCNIHSWLETPSKLGREGTSSASHPVKGDLWKSQLTLFFMEKLNAFPLSSHIRQGCPLSLFNIILSLNAIRKEKEMKVRQKKKKK